MQDAQNIAVNFLDTPISFHLNKALVQYGSSIEYGITAGTTPLTIVSAGDTSNPLISGSIDLKAGGIYSLYLAGQNGKAVDTVFMQDLIPAYNDSVSGVRIINLSVDAGKISANLVGNPVGQNEFSDLGYKQISTFKTYSAMSNIPGYYTFEIRDQTTGDLLTSFDWSYTVFKNSTLVLCGSKDPAAPSPISVFQVNNF
jgi:hypothetical protein